MGDLTHTDKRLDFDNRRPSKHLSKLPPYRIFYLLPHPYTLILKVTEDQDNRNSY